ncbi:hypothetical protein [Paraburkholderia hospita]|uniref:hypothetical protein n=1 Tax=Paraburkholderia hospita TaxID=169430 RepID=UPI000B345BFF|nr:hypothetical protein [Paraburkholderia hospita]OUL79965.1 hypothetical protein CA603_32745 [Paraburkholderia hospita]
MSTLEQEISAYRVELLTNTEATLRVESNTKELVELLKLAKSGVGFFTATGRVLRRVVIWVGPFLTVGGIIWALAHGKWPSLD